MNSLKRAIRGIGGAGKVKRSANNTAKFATAALAAAIAFAPRAVAQGCAL